MTMLVMVLLVVVIALAIMTVIGIYNNLVARRNQVDQAFSTIDVMLKNRYDLIPNLVAVVGRYMSHEADTLARVTELRSQTGGSAPAESRLAADAEISRILGGLRLQIEKYPELKADHSCQQLFSSLEGMEGQISSARRAYNAAVTSFNNAIEMFPSNLFAGRWGFTRRFVLQIPESDRAVPSVKTLFNS
jgi:Uncharacterized conserved protein